MPYLDLAVVVAYFAALAALSLLVRKSRTSDEFMAAGRSLPGWAVGLSIFGSYISSISFLANPGMAFAENWNGLVFSLSIPLAAWVAAAVFVPFYRRRGEVSAYEHLEERFGPWARTYAVVCFVLVQLARMGSIVYLLSLALEAFLGIPRATLIVVTGTAMTLYTLRAGMEAVVWAGVLQSVVLLAATVACLGGALHALSWDLPGMLAAAAAADKFNLGSMGGESGGSTCWVESFFGPSTFWVVLFYGIVTHLGNFGIDQSYVQRYQTAESDRAAVRSVWLGAWLYLPVATVFFFLGTALFVLAQRDAGIWPAGFAQADEVLPFFVTHYLGPGLVGLVIAGILAAAMDSNLSNLATLMLCDVYRRWLRPAAGERESLIVLRGTTVILGAAGTLAALAMMRAPAVLKRWWELSGTLSGGMLGLFLLGLLSRRAGSRSALAGVVSGLLVIAWMSLSPGLSERFASWRSPFHNLWIPVVASLVVFAVGLVVGWFERRGTADSAPHPPH